MTLHSLRVLYEIRLLNRVSFLNLTECTEQKMFSASGIHDHRIWVLNLELKQLLELLYDANSDTDIHYDKWQKC
jgi:hypothetical protein